MQLAVLASWRERGVAGVFVGVRRPRLLSHFAIWGRRPRAQPEFDYATASPLVANLQTAQTALNAAGASGTEAYVPSGGALYAGGRPVT